MMSSRTTRRSLIAGLLFFFLLSCSPLPSVASADELPSVTNEMTSNNAPVITNADSPPDCSSSSSSSTSSRYHALMCWLWNARVTLPQEEFQEQIFTIVSRWRHRESSFYSAIAPQRFLMFFLSLHTGHTVTPDHHRNDLHQFSNIRPLVLLRPPASHLSRSLSQKSHRSSKSIAFLLLLGAISRQFAHVRQCLEYRDQQQTDDLGGGRGLGSVARTRRTAE